MRLFSRQFSLHDFLMLTLGLQPMVVRALLLVLAAGCTLALTFMFRDDFHTFEEQLGALGWRLDPQTHTEERISIVAIDEASIEQLGPWPWPRATLAQLSQALTAAGVQLQLYDIVFPEANTGDAELVAALEAGNAVLAQVPVMQSTQEIRTGVLTHPLGGIQCTATGNTAQSYVGNAAGFAGIAKGHITPLVAADGAVRSVPAFICVDGQAYPGLALSALLTASNAQSWTASVAPGSTQLGPAQVLQLSAYPGFELPLDAKGNLRVSFRNAPDAYRAFSAVDVINGNIGRDLLEDTWVLVGYTAFGLVDIVPTPFSGAAPGVELQARILGSLLDNQVPYTPRSASLLQLLLSLVFAGILLGCASVPQRLAVYGLVISGLLLPLLALLLHAHLLSGTDIWLGWLAPALYSLCASSLLILHGYTRVHLERSRLLNNFRSYLPADLALEIAYSLPNSSIHARRQNVTLLSADLRNFSAYGEARPPEESAALLHFFFVRTTAIIEKHHGKVHEFKGDSLLALWNGSDTTAATHALQAAQEMLHAIQDVLPQHPPAGLEPLALGIGIEQGPVLIGSIGPAHRRSHALLGETVTIALRIQEMTAELASPILVGECAARQLSDFQLESQGSFLLNGLRIPHTLFAPPLQHLPATSTRNDQPLLKVLTGGRA